MQDTVGPEDVLHYAYAVFHSPTYRERYADFLRIDFPRLPLTSDLDLFRRLCKLGARLVALHLLREVPEADQPDLVGSDLTVASGFPIYVPPGTTTPEGFAGKGVREGCVHINTTTFFQGVDEDTWQQPVGGYQPLDKWLKDRRGRTLTYGDVQHYARTAAALRATRDLMARVDDAIAEAGGFPLS